MVKLIEHIRQPEYIGDNRCEPCTILNLVLTAIFGTVIARRSRIGGYVTLVLGVGLVYLRGYIVPGTPVLTQRYFPDSILRMFGKSPEIKIQSGLHSGEASQESNQSTEPNEETEVNEMSNSRIQEDSATIDPGTFLRSAGIIEPCQEADDLCLNQRFEREWTRNMSDVTDSDVDGDDIAGALKIDVTGSKYEIEKYDDARVLVAENGTLGQWPSHDALIADVAAARILDDWVEEWNEFSPGIKGEILNSLRLFLEECPTTGGKIVTEHETVKSCCTSQDVIVITCEETGSRLFEHPVEGIE